MILEEVFDAPVVKAPVAKSREETMDLLSDLSDLNVWLSEHGNPGCKRPSRYPAFAVMNGNRAVTYGLIQFNNNLIPDIQIWRLVANYLHRRAVDPAKNPRIIMKVIVMNRHADPKAGNSVIEPNLDVTDYLVDLASSKPRYAFHPQSLANAVPDVGKYADLKVWNWRIGLEIAAVR